MSQKQPAIETVQWQLAKTTGNPYSQSLHPLMFSQEGLVILKKLRRNKQGLGPQSVEFCNVLYDLSYVKSWIKNKLAIPLTGTKFCDLDMILNTIADSFDEYKDEILMGGEK